MKYCYRLLILVGIILTTSACRSDDKATCNHDNENFESSCCKVPPLNACIGGLHVYIPNVFTPNGDGTNDKFFINASKGTKTIDKFSIYALNGELIFEKLDFWPNDPSHSWNGELPDGSVKNGLYNYNVTITNIADLTMDFSGQVCVRVEKPLECIELEENCAYGTQHNGHGRFDWNRPNREDECD